MTGSDNLPFAIDGISGMLYQKEDTQLNFDEYTFSVYATDKAGHRSMPARVHVTVYDSDTEIALGENDLAFLLHSKIYEHKSSFVVPSEVDTKIKSPLHRHRRQASENVLETREYVVNENDVAPVDLFSVASYPAIPEERFVFAEPAPVGLLLDEVTGLVSREASHIWANDVEEFDVVVTRIDDMECKFFCF